MAKYIIEESPPLSGIVKIGGSKNAALPIMAATLLCPETCVIDEVPALTDVMVMRDILCEFGAEIAWKPDGESLAINAAGISPDRVAPYELTGKIRASFLALGPLLARLGRVKIPLPGGCPIGARPIDLHLKGMAALGASITQEHGFVEAEAASLTGANVYLDFPSVGATENIMMAAVLAQGQTILQNCAVEPEIVDLANFLSSMGAQIRGAGTDTIKISGLNEAGLRGGGGDRLRAATHAVIPDRVEAATFMSAAAATRGEISLHNVLPDHVRPIIAKLTEMGVTITELQNGLSVCAKAPLTATDIKTLPYPGFPTDAQAPFMGVLATAQGTGIVTETVFENRFTHAQELARMGAEVKVEGRTAIVEGVERLTGAQTKATDLRAGAALAIAALRAVGTSEINDVYHIERGYKDFDKKLRKLGGKVTRVEDA